VHLHYCWLQEIKNAVGVSFGGISNSVKIGPLIQHLKGGW
jgi:hypothetical protein